MPTESDTSRGPAIGTTFLDNRGEKPCCVPRLPSPSPDVVYSGRSPRR